MPRPDWRAAARDYLAGARIEPRREASVVEELAQHLEARYQELCTGGMAAAEAETAVRTELAEGPQERDWRRGWRAARGLGWASWAGWRRDLRQGGRRLAHAPGFVIVAVLSLALGIGANAAVFQVLDALVLRSLPVRDPAALAQVRTKSRDRTGISAGYGEFTYALYRQIAAAQRGFRALGAWGAAEWNTARGGQARMVRGMWVSGNLFGLLGAGAARGRLIVPSDDQPGCGAPAAVLSYAYWQSAYGGAPIAGKAIWLDGHLAPIVGVTAAGFTGLETGRPFDVALPLCAEPLLDGSGALLDHPAGWWLEAMGRLKPGWTIHRAAAQLAAVAPSVLRATLPPDYDARARQQYLALGLTATPGGKGFSQLRRQYEEALWLLLALAGLVLAVACANLANLLLARHAARQPELALRAALGATRSRLIRQLLAECLILAAGGVAGGAAIAEICSRVLARAFGGSADPVFLNLSPDWRLLGFLAALAVIACLLFGLAPALIASRVPPAAALQSGGRGLAGGGGRLRRGLAIGQVALALVLLVSALLFVATLRNLLTVNTGFRKTGVLVAAMDLTPLHLTAPQRIPYRRLLLARLQRLPGVASAATLVIVPESGDLFGHIVRVNGAGSRRHLPWFNVVSPGYFATFGTPLLAGRDFNTGDGIGSPLVAIVTQAFSRQYLGGGNPVGRSFRIEGNRGTLGPAYRIVGMAADFRYFDPRQAPHPVVFLAQAQNDSPGVCTVALRAASGDAGALTGEVRQAVAAVNPAISIRFQTIAAILKGNVQQQQLTASLAGLFGGLAVLLALVGLYGVIAYSAAQRRNEMGVRLALGATPGRITRLVLAEAGWLLATGLAIGAVLAWLAGRAAASLLFGVRPADPAVLAGAVIGLGAAGLLAALAPARRAAAADP
ncbi:MAG: ADOP family duplicated permease, partial [Terriglobales bacterium]